MKFLTGEVTPVRIEFNLADQDIDLECPTCQTKFRARVQDLLDPEKTTACPACGQLFRSKTSIDDVQRSVTKAAGKAVARRVKKRRKRK